VRHNTITAALCGRKKYYRAARVIASIIYVVPQKLASPFLHPRFVLVACLLQSYSSFGNATLNRTTLSRFITPEVLFFLLVWTTMLVLFRERGFFDPGALWHIKVGELILDHGFMHTDPFTYTFQGEAWIPQQWGAEVLMALAHKVDKFDTLLLAFATGIATLFTMIFARMRRAGMHWILAGVLTGACLFAGSFHYFVRPHMFTIALLAWTMASLVDFDRGRATLWRLAGLVPLYVLWTNLHGGVLGGNFTFGLAVAGWGLLFLFKQDSPCKSWRTGWILLGILALCGLTPIVNPFGIEMINTWQRIVSSPVLKEHVNEHKPLDLARDADRVIAGFAVLYAALFLGTLPKRPRVTWLIPFVWFTLTFQGIRQGPLFVITAAMVIPDLWPETVWCRLLKKYGDSLVVEPSTEASTWNFRTWLIPGIAVAIAFLLQSTHTPVPVFGHGWVRLSDDDGKPLDLTDSLQKYAREKGPNARVFNDANLGGYMIYFLPEIKIYMDDRFELYGNDWAKNYVDMMHKYPERIEAVMTKYELELAVIPINKKVKQPMEQYLEDQSRPWQALSSVMSGVVYVDAPETISEIPRWKEEVRGQKGIIYRRLRP